jgi:AcrR family transcriptional regulator
MRESSVNKILDASLRLFAENGYEATSISQIALEAGISKGLIYNYFDSKMDLLKGLIDRLNQGESRIMASVMDEDPKEMLRKIFDAFFTEIIEHKEVWKMITSLSIQIEKFDFAHKMTVSKLQNFTGLFEDLLSKTGHPHPRQEARLISALFDGIAFHYLLAGDDYPVEEVREYLLEKYCI